MSQQKEAQDKKSMNFVTHKEINTRLTFNNDPS